eukprot:SM000410S15566  [mRNA]  locus=s410:4526:6957:+ [translate_table: standard]
MHESAAQEASLHAGEHVRLKPSFRLDNPALAVPEELAGCREWTIISISPEDGSLALRSSADLTVLSQVNPSSVLRAQAATPLKTGGDWVDVSSKEAAEPAPIGPIPKGEYPDKISPGDFVRMRADVESPAFGWPRYPSRRHCGQGWPTGRVIHVASDGLLTVEFPSHLRARGLRWLADPAQVQRVSFGGCRGLARKYQHLEAMHWAVRPLAALLAFMLAARVGPVVVHSLPVHGHAHKEDDAGSDKDAETRADSRSKEASHSNEGESAASGSPGGHNFWPGPLQALLAKLHLTGSEEGDTDGPRHKPDQAEAAASNEDPHDTSLRRERRSLDLPKLRTATHRDVNEEHVLLAGAEPFSGPEPTASAADSSAKKKQQLPHENWRSLLRSWLGQTANYTGKLLK